MLVKNFNGFINEITELLNSKFFRHTTEKAIICSKTPEDYKQTIKYLKLRQGEFHKYQLKQ